MIMEGMDGLNNNSDGDSHGSSSIRTNGTDSSENESDNYGSGGDSQFLLWGDATLPLASCIAELHRPCKAAVSGREPLVDRG